jgi:hypothetical protein
MTLSHARGDENVCGEIAKWFILHWNSMHRATPLAKRLAMCDGVFFRCLLFIRRPEKEYCVSNLFTAYPVNSVIVAMAPLTSPRNRIPKQSRPAAGTGRAAPTSPRQTRL